MTTEPVALTTDGSEREAPDRTARNDKGSTVIDDRVRRRLVEHAVRSASGTAEERGLTSLIGLGLPSVEFSNNDRSVDVKIAAIWPFNSAHLVSEVQSSINNELARSLAERPNTARVHIARVIERRPGSKAPAASGSALKEGEPSDPSVRTVPRKTAGSVFVAIPVLLVLMAVGIVAIRDTVIWFGWAHGSRWIDAVLRIADDLKWEWWTWPAAIAAVALGGIFVTAALKPRRRSHTAVTDHLWFGRTLHSRRREEFEVPS
ncbi:Asp23/Gls24 family envelope stress response protein OS=Tsukamurella paurometabola (strain ATCC 8368/ DSM / CCUG 35730 / CIP 100753 / JCM 10117 / KCTC 9821/ NBRC 16120 / NCIMB 702349 / NCTC 13040) OX=521096 GN=Tpau_0287 PE=4 SV=1 [Tsukamurella paurometabola]|uniref:Asp23/Gls24 family envelope stress response protein n=1 Tax=Tsukamurella paurometabola (strain ATCC 8368 / DSM 20162 / CCUG 35730 / CIP 100753 / JCM 10117 / KCTC 9821 / NBRC 16120 / NCIMB 702349 / NCTC 13040) TaxID=521096 RepID=D5UQV1_TSUPD|nr:hypothetical protein [Tsukamurella paurometabola]ADG76934.1 conserved hypothetical protein [Tsukamurella paurometabola DSM 20162]SUP42262.1 Uncharacterised protein [Tsukamurella paurometabola]